MSMPPLVPNAFSTIEDWVRRASDGINASIRRLLQVGSTAERPINTTSGQMYYDETLGRPVWWNKAAGAWQGSEGAQSVVTKTADFTLGATENNVVVNKTGSSCTVTIPAASDWPDRVIRLKTLQAQTVVSASTNVRPIASNTAGTAILPATAGAWCQLVSDGAAWVTMARGT